MKPFPIDTAISAKKSPDVFKALLESHFGNDDNYEIQLPDESNPDEYQGQTFPDGSSVVQCTNYAGQVFKQILNYPSADINCKILGFSVNDNPSSSIAQECGGHDFALINDRFIVDGWLKNVDEGSSASVFDLESPQDAEQIMQFYGDISKATRLNNFESAIISENVRSPKPKYFP